MGQLERVSWRTVGYAALGTALAASSVIAIINSDGVRPTSLTSSAASRWLVDQINGNAVLVDGLAGRVVARIEAETARTDEVAVQGAGGAFLVGKAQGSVRTISTAKLQLGSPLAVGLLLDPGVQFGVGTSGLTVVSPETKQASVIALDDVTRPIAVPKADHAYVAADGSMWMVNKTDATHVNVDASRTNVALHRPFNQTSTVGSHAVSFDANNSTLTWLDGRDVPLPALQNASEARLQEPGDDAPCAWLGVGDTLLCVGPSGIDRGPFVINGMNISSNDRLAVAGSAAVIVTPDNTVTRIDLENQQLVPNDTADVRDGAPQLTITSAGDLIWLDDQGGNDAWIVNRFGIKHVAKDDKRAPLLDAQGQAKVGDGTGGQGGTSGVAAGDEPVSHDDHNGKEDPPHAEPDSVTARAGNTIIIPVTANDWDPDGDAIAVISVGDTKRATHGTTDVLDGSSVSYKPDPGFSGTDTFEYTIVDEKGLTDTAAVSVELFPPGSPNQPPIARADKANTRLGHPVTIDVLANDIDPERDLLTVKSIQNDTAAIITDTSGPTNLPALKFDPPDAPGTYPFTYQAADPQGGTSQKTKVVVTVSASNAQNVPPIANPDAVRLPVGKLVLVDVKANDTDDDGDDLTIAAAPNQPAGVDVEVRAQRLAITLGPGAAKSSVANYTLSDGQHTVKGKVLVLRVDNSAPNRPPVANADAERVVIGNSVIIPVTANDVDPDHDDIRLLTAVPPADGAGTTVVEGNSVRFTPNLPDITDSTFVSFTYVIGDGHGNEATGNVTVQVLLQALPRAPFARDDFADTVVDKPVTIDVLNNDSDPSGGQPNLIGVPTCTGGGSATSTPDNRVVFVPPLGLAGTFRCKYTVINSQLLKAEANIIVTVTAPPVGNHIPVLDSPQPLPEVKVGAQITLSASQFATDTDGDPLVFTSASKPNFGSTDFTSSNASFTYTAPATGSADKTPESDNIDVTISDGQGGNVPASISIKIIDNPPVPPAPAPPQPLDFSRSAFVGDQVLVDVVTLLHDRNSGMTLTLNNVSVDSGPGTASNVNGIVNVTTTGAGTIIVNYVVANADNLSATGKITVTVTEEPQNTPPVAVDDTLTIPSGGSNSVDLLANDSGINDPGDKATVILVNRPPASFGSVDVSGGVLTFVAAADASGVANIKYTLSDGSGQSSTANISLTILQCSESLPSGLNATAFTPYMTPLAINLQDYVTSGSIRPGSVSGAGLTGPSGVYTPPAGMNGTEIVTFIVENGCHQAAQFQLTIDVNRAPVAGTVSESMSPGDVVVLNAANLATDDEALTISSIAGNQSWVTLQPPNTTGGIGASDQSTIKIAPPNNVSGPFGFSATVMDPGGLTAVATINVSVSNLPPTAVDDQYPPTTDSLITFDPTLNDNDPEGGPLTVQSVSWVTPATGGTISVTGNNVTVPLSHGVSTLSYIVADQGGLTDSAMITLTSNHPPTMPDITETFNQPSIDVTVSPTDPDGDDTVVSCAQTASPPNFDIQILRDPDPGPPPNGGRVRINFAVLNGFEGTDAFTCRATDPFGGFGISNVSLTITP